MELEQIIPKCEIANGYKPFNDSECSKGIDPLNCCYKLFYKDVCYCKFETILNQDKAELFAKWMEL